MGLDMFLYKIKKEKGVTLAELLQAENHNLEEMIYWRKANQIHNWFDNNIPGGVEDCGFYEISKSQLENLLETCKKVVKSSELIKGKVKNGETLKNGKWEPIFEPGMIIKNNNIAKKLLPGCDGFFFGNTEYDEYYINQVNFTIEQLEKMLKDFDFDNNYVVYHAWW